MIWFFGALVGAILLSIGSRLPTRKIKRVQFGYGDPLVSEHCKRRLLTLGQLYQQK